MGINMTFMKNPCNFSMEKNHDLCEVLCRNCINNNTCEKLSQFVKMEDCVVYKFVNDNMGDGEDSPLQGLKERDQIVFSFLPYGQKDGERCNTTGDNP
jgi:hypothetical protein